jgi:hypothetical protein
VVFQPGAESLIFLPFFLAESLNLHQIGYLVLRHYVLSPSIAFFSPFVSAVLEAICPDKMGAMDQLSLSMWLMRSQQNNRLRQFEKLLRLFPFSQRSQPQSIISIHGIDHTEPPLLERPVNGPLDATEIMSVFEETVGSDIAYEVESWWDLWQFEKDWELAPSRIALACFGPDFDNGAGAPAGEQEHLRIDFGPDIHFLPQSGIWGSTKLVESNIRSLLRLVHELDSSLSVEKRKLETESGENFADRLQELLT